MDYSNRNPQAAPAAPAPQATGPAHRQHKVKDTSRKDMWSRVGIVAAILAVVILLIGIIALIYADSPDKTDETKYVKSSKLQAVFLNTGQVYFGNIQSINNQNLVLTNIYYLQTNSSSGSSSTSSTSSSASNNVTLVKLGCELHMPYDQMVINNSEVTFWENLQSTGQVAKAVSTFQQQNPNGQKCSTSSSSSSTSGTGVQSSGSSTTKQ
jgi:hypothetical protein